MATSSLTGETVSEKPRKGVYCSKACGTEALDDFYPLMQATGIEMLHPFKGVFVKAIMVLSPEHCRLFMCLC